VLNRDIEAVRSLLTRGTPVDTVNVSGAPLIHLAADRVSPKLVKLLLEHGADVNSFGSQGTTPLFEVLTAFETGITTPRTWTTEDYSATIECLLDRGATFRTVRREGQAAVHYHGLWWYIPELSRRIIDECRDCIDPKRGTPLMAAVMFGSLDQVRDLLRSGADSDARDSDGRTALFRAAAEPSHIEKAELLIESGATIDVVDLNGDTPIMYAARFKNFALVRILVDEGADLNTRNRNGETVRDIAMQVGEVAVVNAFRSSSDSSLRTH